MKKHLLALAFSAFCLVASAQSFSMYDVQSSSNISSGTYLYYNHTDPATFFDFHVDIHNTTQNTVNVKVRKAVLYTPAGTTTQFCTDQLCYTPTTTLSPGNTPINGMSMIDLKPQYKPESNTPATMAVRYSVFNVANPADSVFFIVVYNGVTGIPQLSNEPVTLSSPAPNPASGSFSMNFQLGSKSGSSAQIVIYNMLGEKVKETALLETEGNVKIDVSTLQQGVYFCALSIEGKAVITRRVVVTR